jgi:hypothetical protein
MRAPMKTHHKMVDDWKREPEFELGREERQKREGPAVIAGPSQSAGKFGVVAERSDPPPSHKPSVILPPGTNPRKFYISCQKAISRGHDLPPGFRPTTGRDDSRPSSSLQPDHKAVTGRIWGSEIISTETVCSDRPSGWIARRSLPFRVPNILTD